MWKWSPEDMRNTPKEKWPSSTSPFIQCPDSLHLFLAVSLSCWLPLPGRKRLYSACSSHPDHLGQPSIPVGLNMFPPLLPPSFWKDSFLFHLTFNERLITEFGLVFHISVYNSCETIGQDRKSPCCRRLR